MNERLFALWQRQFISELESRRDDALRDAATCAEGGWYRKQIEQAAAMYQSAIYAVSSSDGSAKR